MIVFILMSCVIDVSLGQIFENHIYKGRLTPQCVAKYERIIVQKQVPPRDYKYYHETLEAPSPTGIGFRIVGGDAISISKAPYNVLYGLYCGGALLSPEWVLTAAHCEETDDFVVAGSTWRLNGTHYPVCAHFTHPGYGRKTKLHVQDYDFQLLLLERAVPVSELARPVAVGRLLDVRPGALVTVSGWGHAHYKDRMQNVLREVKVPIMEQSECRAANNSLYHNITERMFCAAFPQGKKDACQGDSGGPAVLGGRLVGSVSFGVGCASAGFPGVYARVPAARPWIRHVTSLPL